MAIFIIQLLHNLIHNQYKHHEAPIWNMYTLCEVGGKIVAKCRDCETSVSAKSDRLRNHMIKCGAVTKNTPHKRTLDTDDIDQNPTSVM